MANDKKKKSGNFGRVLYYFWKALMQNKIRVILLLMLIPIYVFIMNILVPRGTSEIIGQLSSGDLTILC